MAKPPGRCIFCEQTGLTKEHVFPDWMNGVYPKGSYNKLEHLRAFDPKRQADQLVGESSRIHQGGPANRKVRVVCTRCNTGWLSRLQNRAKPVLIPLIQGDGCLVKVAAQRIIALWGAVIAITAEYTQPSLPHAITPQDRHYMWRNDNPPDDWQIWIGHYIGTEKAMSYAQVRFTLSPKGSSLIPSGIAPTTNTQVATMIFGKLYLYLFASSLGGIGPLRLGDHLRPIWPLSGSDISWPPTLGLSDRDRISLNNRLLAQLGVSSP
jgi:hypothetical protein